MISDYLMYLKALESSLLDLPKLQETESLSPREAAWLLINLLNLHPQEKMFYCLEVQEIEKLKDISVFAQVKRAHTLLLVSDQLVENSRWPEAEDDSILFKYLFLTMKSQILNKRFWRDRVIKDRLVSSLKFRLNNKDKKIKW
jgi:hypothetical protein